MAKAMRLSEEAVGAGAVHPTLLSLTALKRMQAGDNQGALPLLLRARELAPRHADLLNALGHLPDAAGPAARGGGSIRRCARQSRRSRCGSHLGRAHGAGRPERARRGARRIRTGAGAGPGSIRRAVAAGGAGGAARRRSQGARACHARAGDRSARPERRPSLSRRPRLQQKDISRRRTGRGGAVAAIQDLGPINRAFALSLAGDVLDGHGPGRRSLCRLCRSPSRSCATPMRASMARARKRAGA